MSSSDQGNGATASRIAVVGMAGRFAGASDAEALWRNLRGGVESIRRYSEEELIAAGVPRSLLDDPHYVRAGAPLPDMEKFDAGFFGLAPLDASIMDPQHRHFLECCWEAFEHAGIDPARFAGSVGVFAGCGHGAYLPDNLLTNPGLVDQVGFFLLRHTGNDKDFLATRVSYEFDLKGPSVSVQTACSTSLVAVHLACQSLLGNECDLALAGGASIELPHRHGYLYRDGEILSPDGHCRTFDADAAGTVFGSGVGVVVLRRLEDALADGDPVLAVILGSAVNNDGSSKVGYLAPSVDGQAGAVAEALAVADVDPRTIRFVECHGTGTPLGDPIEVAALTRVFRQSSGEKGFCAIGSIKPNIGHTDTAAGVASLIKVVQALRYREIPPTLHFRAPNPELALGEGPFYVNAAAQPWPEPSGPRRAAASSLGVGGTNAHVVVEEAPARERSGPSRPAQLLLLSGRTESVVERAAGRLADHLRGHPELPFADVAHTSRVGRRHFRHRRALVCRSAAEAVSLLEDQPQAEQIAGLAPERAPTLAFLFPGGGAQYPDMGRALYTHEPYYRDPLDAGLDLLEPALRSRIRALLFPDPAQIEEAAREFEKPSVQLPALFLVEYALAQLLLHWGLRPTALAGHSMGENTAAAVAGVLSLRDALGLVCLRGRLFERVPEGAMLSVPLPGDELTALLEPDLQLASANAPELCVASGPIAAIERLEQKLRAREIDSRRVRIRIAAHSAMLDPILPEWRAYLRKIELHPPSIPIVSNTTGTWLSDEEATDPEYWVRHLRSTVRFADDVAALLADPDRVLVEVGPGHALTTLARAHPARTRERIALPSLPRPDDAGSDLEFVLASLGRLWTAGVAFDSAAFDAGEIRNRVTLPPYPWEHQRHWIEPGAVRGAVSREGVAREDDVGRWLQVVGWRRTPGTRMAPAGPVLAFLDGAPLAEALVDALRAAGRRVVEVREGARFEAVGEASFRLRPGESSDYEALFQQLGAAPTDLVHGWNLGASGSRATGAREQVRAFDSLVALAQALGREDVGDPLRLHVLTAAIHEVGGERPGPAVQALSFGALRVMPREYPNLRCRNIDVVVSGAEAQELARALGGEIGDARDDVVALRGGHRFVPTFEPLAAGDLAPAEAVLREGGVYLITGGLGGLGLELAEHFAKLSRARLALISRRALPTRDEWDGILARASGEDPLARCLRSLRAIEASGGEVVTYAADVCDSAALRRVVEAVRARFGALHGVVHAAGTLDDALIQQKSKQSVGRVLAPKVAGTLALDAALAGTPLDFLWLYSSLSAWAGLAGQVDYAAANAFLDAFARERSARADGGPTLSIAWGAWRDVGMAAELARRGEGVGASQLELTHPLLDRLASSRSGVELYASEFSPADHWVLDEHRLEHGDPLLPGTAYLELARAALLATNGDAPIQLEGILLLSPFRVQEGARRELRIRIDRASGEFAIASPVSDGENPQFVEHARGTAATLSSDEPPRAHRLEELRVRCGHRILEGDKTPRPAHLLLGPRWDCVRSVALGDGEAFAELELAETFHGDLPRYALHPSLLDMATGCAHSLIDGHETECDLFVPISYGRVALRRPLPARFFSHLRLRPDAAEDFAIFDVTLLSETGEELASVEELMLKRVREEETLGAQAPPLAAAGEFDDAPARDSSALGDDLRSAIRPEEGRAAIDALLASRLDGHVFVTAHPVGPWLAQIDERSAPPPSSAPRLDPATLAELRQVETAIAALEGVAEVAVTAHFDRPGERRLLAHVVWDADHAGTVSELRRELRKRLADDLVPQNFVELDTLPRTAAGEVDSEALEDPFGVADDYVAPRTSSEKALARVWKQILGIDRVGIHDNFFDIGGHSLLAMRVIVRLDKELGVRLNNAIMVLQTLEQVAAECDRQLGRAGAEDGASPDAASESTKTRARGISGRLLDAVKRGFGDRTASEGTEPS